MLAASPIASDARERPRGAVLCDVAGYVGCCDADLGLCNSGKSKALISVRSEVHNHILRQQHRSLEHNMNGDTAYPTRSKFR